MTESIHFADLSNINILVFDQDLSVLRSIKRSLQKLQANVFVVNSIADAYQLINQEYLHAILSETELKQGNVYDLLKRFRSNHPNGLFFLMAENVSENIKSEEKEQAVNQVFKKPVNISTLSTALKPPVNTDDKSVSTLDPLTTLLRPYLIFRSPVMRQRLMMLPRMASTAHSILITGETGTGKEMVARAIHGLSGYNQGPFIALNCGAIPENLIEGELFGHEKGAFTGALATKKGKFELAQDGTLLLDEMGEMPLLLQARLLRVLEEKQFYRVGGEKPIDVNVRIVAATQVELEKAVENGLFREDLYYRLNILRVHIPALRERTDDIPLLAWHFLERAFAEINRRKPYPSLSRETIHILKQLEWKGNVRELRNMITRLAVLLPLNTSQITPDYLAAYFPEKVIQPSGHFQTSFKNIKTADYQEIVNTDQDPNIIEVKSYHHDENESINIPLGTSMRDAEDLLIKATLHFTKGNRTKAAKLLGIGLRTIRRKINEPK